MRALLLAVAFLATSAHAGEPPRFDARASLQRAKVGTYSDAGAPPARVVVVDSTGTRRPLRESDLAERMECERKPSNPRILTCEIRSAR